MPVIAALLPVTSLATCLEHVSATCWSKAHTDRHLPGLATEVREIYGLARHQIQGMRIAATTRQSNFRGVPNLMKSLNRYPPAPATMMLAW